jgi:hypothetical protein
MRELKKGKYTAPSGAEILFDYYSVSRETELKTGVYTFPARDGARVQHQGKGAVTFPLTCIFSGEDCTDQADAFEATLIERGTGELEHPLYGTVKVKPTGNIQREDNLVSAVNESTVTVTFTETITDEDEEALTEVSADAVEEKYEEFSEAAAEDFAESLAGVESVGEQLAVEAALEAQAQSMIDALQPMAMTDRSSFADWLTSAKELKDSIKRLYNKGMKIAGKIEDTYVKALNIARLTLRIMKLPSKLATSLSLKIQGYSALTATLINQFKNDPFEVKKIKNAFSAAWLGLSASVASIASGAAVSTAEAAARSEASASASGRASAGYSTEGSSGGDSTGGSSGGGSGSGSGSDTGGGTAVLPNRNSGTASREEAVETAKQIIEMLESITAFGDTKTALDVFVAADAASYTALIELVYQSAQLVMNASFALPMQRTFTLDRDRQVIELCAELYGTVDCLDDFIIVNNFNIDEIELLPMGTKVSYYVQSA